MSRPLFHAVYGRPLMKFPDEGDTLDHDALHRLADEHHDFVHHAYEGVWWFGEKIEDSEEIDAAYPVMRAERVNLSPSPEQKARVEARCEAILPDWLKADEALLDLDVFLIRSNS